MSKFLATAAMVVGGVALVATGVGAAVALSVGTATTLGGAVAAAGIYGISASTLFAISAGLSVASSLLAKKPGGTSGSQTDFKADPASGVPYVIGRTYVGGDIRYWRAHGSDNKYETLVTILSGAGPIVGIEQTFMDRRPIEFDGAGGVVGNITGDLAGLVHQDVQLGETPEAGIVSTGVDFPPGWTSDHKLSGLAATMLTLKYDAKGDITLNSTPGMAWVAIGVKGYDPRLDDTYPGGSGDCRARDESTYVDIEGNPYLHGLTWALGRLENDVNTFGAHVPAGGIDMARYVEGANVCDANGWKAGGQYTSLDGKWNVLKAMLQAGGGQPLHDGAMLSALVQAPRVSLGTIEIDDIAGESDWPAMQTRRDRINTGVPRYRSEDHQWQQVSAAAVSWGDAVTEDGGLRTRELEFPLVQCFEGDDPDQAAQLAAYEIRDSREGDGIIVPLKLRWMAYRIGDCLTVGDIGSPFDGSDVIITRRSIDPVRGVVELTLRTEDASKHAWALAQTGTAPPVEDIDGMPSPPDAPEPMATLVTAIGDVGEADVSWRNPVLDFAYVKVWRHTANAFDAASAISGEIVGGLGEAMSITDTGLSAGTYWYWIVAYDESDAPYTESSPDDATVT